MILNSKSDEWATRIDEASSVEELRDVVSEIEHNNDLTAEDIYYLGTAYLNISDLYNPDSNEWYQNTINYRALSKYHLSIAYSMGLDDSILATRAITNRTKLLYREQRWVEALHDYQEAVKIETFNGVASSAIVKITIDKMRQGVIPRDFARLLIRKYYPLFLESEKVTDAIAGAGAYDFLDEELEERNAFTVQDRKYKNEKAKLNKYDQFCLENELHLLPFLPRAFFDLEKSDNYDLAMYIQGDSKADVTSAQLFFSEIKNCFIVARFNAFQHFCTKKGATHFLLASQKLAFDILDKIAVAVYSIVSNQNKRTDDPKYTFSKVWFESTLVSECKVCKKKRYSIDYKKIKSIFKEEISKNNCGLIALIELSYDLYFKHSEKEKKRTYMSEKQKLRHSSTHSFVITGKNYLKSFREIDKKELEREVLETLFMVKSAIIYFVEFIYGRNTHLYHSNDNK